jgi:thioredoxin-related protein
MPYRIMITALVLVMALAGCAKETADQGEHSWMTYNEGMKLAAKLGRPVVIDFYTSWCKWCKVMERETFSNEKVASYLGKNFICIRVNAEDKTGSLVYEGRTYSQAGLAKAFKVKYYPSIAYLDGGGKLLFVDPGFKKPDQFMVNLAYITGKCYEKNVTLDEFRRRGGKCD